jgi:hypothetical protein
MPEHRVRVVNMIPNSMSGETNQDSEPQLTVDPENRRTIIGTTFTPPPGGGSLAPLFVSLDGGHTWALDTVIPNSSFIRDQSVRFGGASTLYAGVLYGGAIDFEILRGAPYTPGTVLSVLINDTTPGAPIDQPYVGAIDSHGKDRVFIGNNDQTSGPWQGSVEHSSDARTPPPPGGFKQSTLDQRLPHLRELPPVRSAPHRDGTVYVGYLRAVTYQASDTLVDVVVARDDDFAQSATPFTDLLDPGDGLPGLRVVQSVPTPWTGPWTYLGHERVGASLSMAVDPRDSDVAYLAFATGPSLGVSQSLQVRRTTDRGATWSGDLVTVPSATNAQLAITRDQRVGFLYQQLVTPPSGTPRWETHVQVSRDGWATAEDIVLANTPNDGYAGWDPYLGDYADLQAVDEDLYAIFSALNTPDLANFPHGVRFHRNADFTAHQLLDVNGVTPVASSIDPFFAHIWWPEEHEEELDGELEEVVVKGLHLRLDIGELKIRLRP